MGGPELRGLDPGARDLRVTARPSWFETPHRLSGRIVDWRGEPLAGARVEGRPVGFAAPPRFHVSDEEGRFCLMGLRPGRWRLSVTGPGADVPGYVGTHTDGETRIGIVLPGPR